MKFYKAYILFDHKPIYGSPMSFDVDINTIDGKHAYKVLEYAGWANSNKIYKISEYDEDNNVKQLSFFCSDYETILNFWDGLLIGKTVRELTRTIEFSRN